MLVNGVGVGVPFAPFGRTQSNNSAASPLVGFFSSFWKLADLTDSIGSNTLTNTNLVTFAAGKIGNAAVFGATNQDLRVAASLCPVGTSRTVALWFNPSAVGLASAHGFFSVNNTNVPIGGNPVFILGVSNVANKLYLYQSGAYHNGTTTLSASTYYCVVYTFDSATNTNTVYLNGNVEIAGYVGADANVSTTVYIGAGFPAAFGGQVDACGIATGKIASAAQISAFYNAGAGVEPPF